MNDIPYTNAGSDFMKFVKFKEDEKSSLIDFAATDFDELKNALVNYVKAVYPLDYNNFAESDLGVMFIELVAYMGAVMSMKADMLAHEGFLKTSRNINNVRKLLEIIGVRMRGPSSAVGQASVSSRNIIAPGQSLLVNPEDRVIVTTSPEDGQAITYTLYTVDNGAIADPAYDGTIELLYEDSDNGVGPDGKNWNNLVLVEGAFAIDEGTFTDVDILKEISLSQKPVIDGSVQVFVSSFDTAVSGVYTELQSLVTASSGEDKVFSIVYGDDFSAKVLFGDGVAGVLPPAGAYYKIMYRVGGGSRGNAKSAYLSKEIPTTDGNVLDITNITPFTGGADAETVKHAKKYGKLVFRQQQRLVSSDDYNSFVNTFSGPIGTTGKGNAVTRKAFSSGNIIDVYLLERASNLQLQKASISFKNALLEAMNSKKMMTDEIVLVDGLARTLDITLNLSVDAKYKSIESNIANAVSRVVTEYFNLDNREFGETFYPDDLGKEIFTQVPQVRLAVIDNYKEPIILDFNEIIQLNNFILNFNYV